MPLQIPPEIEINFELIVHAVGQESVEVYRFLRKRFSGTNPKSDLLFQFLFRSFYRLDNAGLTTDFKIRFFELLAEGKENGSVDVATIVRSLFEMPNRKGQSSLQFSFASKLAATVDPAAPIYDAEVATVFGFRVPYTYRPFEQRLAEYLGFYVDLTDLYRSIIENDTLPMARHLFRTLYQAPETDIPETKVIDFIFWSAGKLRRDESQ